MKTKAVFLILFLSVSSGFCAEDPLIIAISKNFPPFSFLNVESRPAGLFVDIWRLWAEKTGRDIEFRPEQWVDALKCFKTGEVHIHGGLFRCEERETWIEFSKPFFKIDIYLIYPASNGEFTSLGDLGGRRVGVHQGTYQETWLRTRYPDIVATPLRTTQDLIFAAKEGKIRAFLADAQSSWAHLYQLGLSAEFRAAPAPLYSRAFHAGVLKGNATLLEQINRGFDAISDQELAEIEMRWIHDPKYQNISRRSRKIELSTAESRFIQKHPVVRVGLIPGFEPYMFLDDAGAFQGVIPDYLRLIENRTGLRIDQVSLYLPELRDAMGKNVDMFPGLESPERSDHMLFTRTVLSDPWVLVNRKEASLITGLRDLKKGSVSLMENLYIQKRLRMDYPEIRLLPSESHEQALKNASVGLADAYIGPLAVAGYLIQRNRFTNLKIAAPAGYPGAEMKFGVRRDRPELVGILNKAIADVARREFDAILQKWVPAVDERGVAWKIALKWMAAVAAGFSALLVVSLWWNRKLTVEMNERKNAEHALHRIEWLLTKSVAKQGAKENVYAPPYGDVTELNACRVILDAVGKETLQQIAEDAIDLLDTSVAVYEANGDYAFGMFSSGWCRLLDLSSRRLCNTDDNHKALTSGKWLCHENCWNDSAQTAIQSREIMDIECVGGIRMYAVPIFAGDDVIGVINIGYGDPPTDEQTLLDLSDRFNVAYEEIREAADLYHSRPDYFIELAKKRLRTAADLIGEIVERKRAEELSQESERRFRKLFQYANDGICIVDSDGRFVMVNQRMCDMFEYDEEAFQRMTVHDVSHPEDVNVSPKVIEKYKTGEIEYTMFEKRYLTRQGRTIWGQVASSVVRNADGDVQYYISHLRDMTDRKRAEEQLKQYSEHLKDMVEDRTRELKDAQAELLVKERLAVLGHFSGSISHELRNPLAAIDASAYYLNARIGDQDETTRVHLGRIRNNTKKSTDIIQSLLNLSRMEKPKTGQHDLCELIREILQTSRAPDGVSVAMDFQDKGVRVDIDPEQIRIALKNLIQNAVQAMEDSGKLTVKVQKPCREDSSARRERQTSGVFAQQTAEVYKTSAVSKPFPKQGAGISASQDGMIEISISDTGPGISRENIEKVFSPLFTTKTHGIGFGLSITKMIIDNHGGTIRVEPESEIGATFTVTLPLAGKGEPING